MDATELSRLRWRCRRGLLENDLILARFMDARGPTMSDDEVAGARPAAASSGRRAVGRARGPRGAGRRCAASAGCGAARGVNERRELDATGRRSVTSGTEEQSVGGIAAGDVQHLSDGADIMTRPHRQPDLLGWFAERHVSDPEGDDRPRRHRHPDALREDGKVHLRPGIHVDRRVQFDDHLHRRRQGRASVSRLSDRGARGEVRLPRGLPSAALRRAAERRAEEGLRRAA